MVTQEQYHADSNLWGGSQYTFLKDIVNNFMGSLDNDSYVSAVPRSQVILRAKQGIKELSYDTMKEIVAREISLDEKLQVVLPNDFVNYVRISKLIEGRLYSMGEDKRTNIAQAYLKDTDGDIVFDTEGSIVLSTGQRETQNVTPLIQN